MKYKFGVTEEWLNAQRRKQHNRCPICNRNFDEVQYNIDHCHSTNIIRGILCSNCNLGIGHFKDDIDLLKKAINYLKGDDTDE